MPWLIRLQRTSPMGEEERAAASVATSLTAATGGMLTLIAAAQGSLAAIALPTAVLIVLMARRATTASAWAAIGVWIFFLPMASGAGLVAPLLMMVLCLALAVGPDRLATWVGDRLTDRRVTPDPEASGWIEDDPSVR